MLALVPIGVLGRAVVGSSLIDAEAWRPWRWSWSSGHLAHGLGGGWGGRICLGGRLGPWLPETHPDWPKCCVRRGERLEFSARLISSQAWSRYVRHRRRQWNPNSRC